MLSKPPPGSAVAGSALASRVALFADLTEHEVGVLSSRLRRRRYPRGQVIFVQGDPGTCLYIVEEGQVKMVLSSPEGREMVLGLLGPGDFFGELSLLDGEPHPSDAIAREPCQLVLLERADFLKFLDDHPRVAARLLATLSRRLRHNAQLAYDVAFLDVPARLARTLLELADAEGRPVKEGIALTSRLTQSDLAALVGATRESVNKWVGFYERHGVIHATRDSIVILRPEELRKRIY